MVKKRLDFSQKYKRYSREVSTTLHASLIQAISHSMMLPLFLVDTQGAVRTYHDATLIYGANLHARLKKGEAGEIRCQIRKSQPELRCLQNCNRCSIRQIALKAIENNEVLYKKDKFCVYESNTLQELLLLLTASPMRTPRGTMAVVLAQDISIVTELQGVLPSCAVCKKIREKGGNWITYEMYIEQHSEAYFSHDLCPECLQNYLVPVRLAKT